jgi:hypothetical protein
MSEKVWESVDELLSLYGIDNTAAGAQDFTELAQDSAALMQYPELNLSTWAVASAVMRERHWSPMIYWGRQKKLFKPLLEAEAETLAALGLTIGEKRTMYALAHAVAAALAERASFAYEHALKIRARIEGVAHYD